MNKNEILRNIPKVDEAMTFSAIEELSSSTYRPILLEGIREEIKSYRDLILSLDEEKLEEYARDQKEWEEAFLKRIKLKQEPSLKKMINGTGVIIHTNLGRSLLNETVLEDFVASAGAYNNLEYNIEKGQRGSRYDHVISTIVKITGAEDALLVNNNASAVLLILQAFSSGGNAIVSRGELVEIGGSFRIPEIMKLSGTELIEVGATNKTHLSDYEEAINEETKLLMKVHQSNFKMMGFTESVDNEELKALADKYDLPLYEDLGSGVFINLDKYGLSYEPTVHESVKKNVDIISFSGDKLLGGPQAGIIIGKKKYIEKMKKHQLLRALRVDKMTIFLLEETLKLYLDEKIAIQKIPTLRMITVSREELIEKAAAFMEEVKSDKIGIKLVNGFSQVGGGSMPTEEIPTVLMSIKIPGLSSNELEEKLRLSSDHIIGRIQENEYLLDPRTLQERDYPLIAKQLQNIASQVKE